MILGLDLSLTATGWAIVWRHNVTDQGTLSDLGSKASWPDRLDAWSCAIHPYLSERPDAIYVEDIGGNQYGAVELGMVHALFWRLARFHAIDGRVTMVNASTLKKYATGKGNASKALVLTEAVRRLGYPGCDDNAADALWLADMGARHAGYERPPLPAAQLAVLDKLKAAA